MTCGRAHPLGTLYVYLTEGCNLRCRHCWIQPKFQSGAQVYGSLDFDLFRHVVDQALPLGLSSVKLTGGEPLLHPRIADIVHYAGGKGLHIGMETNGVLCTPSLAEEIASSRSPHVSVSLDGADAATHEWVRGVSGSFHAALQGIRNLVGAGLRPQVIMTIMKRNAEQVVPVIRLAESLGAGSVKFNLLQPTARGEKMHEAGDNLPIERLVALGRQVENKLARSSRIPLFYSHPAAFRPLGSMFDDGGGCAACGIFGILGVLASGAYALCGIGETVPEFVFGHAAKDRLEEVWNETPMLREIRDGLPRRLEGICGRCLMKTVCLGGCIAQNYYRERNLWAGHWYCEDAFGKGLFPESRLRPDVSLSKSRISSQGHEDARRHAVGG
ncbi:MAG TPA: SynChlorMet cassette radical SAM/SPASM protein ScmF [Syntrophales bacterium]|jgi:SynChlorMet cassette radical SAM/SPASM protein ScmF|nr:SynChlorMet cassette radical SAM/SPASM protein ScmF [Syntrophobacterales bacterium]HNU86437.1 SynChlorMet cassette radical SAM/SPASM protein ScmF [Syntrophales bacterium]HPG71335.1 SynChlorMet cassette radical SAM/SPASM protein ScmF [Syntrophales bacterium]HPV54636.1 SynChlorMet cassette radical SAM/SPASM protein ScmF [Syntrophales bacterium]